MNLQNNIWLILYTSNTVQYCYICLRMVVKSQLMLVWQFLYSYSVNFYRSVLTSLWASQLLNSWPDNERGPTWEFFCLIFMQIYFNYISLSRPFYNHYFFATQIEKLIIGGHRGVGQKPVQSHCGLIESSTFYAGLGYWENHTFILRSKVRPPTCTVTSHTCLRTQGN
jgi:hypothetical protein